MRILTLDDRQEWAELAKPFDIAYTPEYLDLFKDTAFGGEPRLAVSGGIIYPFYIRQIPNSECRDIVSPYGYNGPAGNGDWDKFLFEFHAWCKLNNIVSEFARLHPFWTSYEYLPAIKKNEIVYIDLRQNEDVIWHNFDKGCRAECPKDYKANIEKGCSNEFVLEYFDKMLGKGAANYLFTLNFWDQVKTITYLADNSALLLKHDDYCHYFLSAGHKMNKTIWGSIKWAKSQGCRYFNLGGGVLPDDSLFHFKKSFSKTTLPFYVYQKIHIPEIYEELSQGKETNYFPAYRA